MGKIYCKQIKRQAKANCKALKRRETKVQQEDTCEKWEISLEHCKQGYSEPGMLGEFVGVLLMWCLGAPSILIVCYDMCKMCLYMSIKKNYICTWQKSFTFMLGFPKINLGSWKILKDDW